MIDVVTEYPPSGSQEPKSEVAVNGSIVRPYLYRRNDQRSKGILSFLTNSMIGKAIKCGDVWSV
jgi:hypothetical protein